MLVSLDKDALQLTDLFLQVIVCTIYYPDTQRGGWADTVPGWMVLWTGGAVDGWVVLSIAG